jgi:hypothetical protein
MVISHKIPRMGTFQETYRWTLCWYHVPKPFPTKLPNGFESLCKGPMSQALSFKRCNLRTYCEFEISSLVSKDMFRCMLLK